jgi:DNA primase
MNLLQQIAKQKQDAILWQTSQWLEDASDDVMNKAAAIDKIASLVALVKNEAAQLVYIETVAKDYRINKKTLQKALDKAISIADEESDTEAADFDRMPGWMSKEEVINKGFCTVIDKKNRRIGYYGWSQHGKSQITNFIVHPVFHVGAKENSRHIFEVENEAKRVVLDVPSKVFVSLETLQNHLVGEGAFIFYGSKPQLLRIATELLPHFPMCKELKQLGWQPDGFFAFVNKVFISGSGETEINKWGIFEANKKNYLIPAASDVYKDDEAYENDRVLKLVHSKINFSQWSSHMQTVYQEKGLITIAFVLITIFNDIVFSIDNNCPFLYAYGERNSGKSKLAESINAVFYQNRKPFQMNSAFYGYVSQFRNCPATLNEFDDKVVRDPWFQGTKGFFEGEGRQRNRLDVKNKQETQRAAGTIILLGQFLSTKDDNSIVTRSLILPFFERQFTEEEKTQYNTLKRFEASGLSSLLTEVLQYRSLVKEKYYELFNQLLGAWRRITTDQFNQRIFQNWCHLATMWFLLHEKLGLPVSFTDFEVICYKEAVRWSKFVRETDILSDFWNTVSFLLEQDQVVENWDFKIIETSEIKLRKGSGEEYVQQFGTVKKLLVIRLNNVHKLYQMNYRSRNGKEAMNLENLMHYFSSRNYFIGKVKQMQFKRYILKNVEMPGNTLATQPNIQQQRQAESTITSAFVFDYDLLGCDLERQNPNLENQPAF